MLPALRPKAMDLRGLSLALTFASMPRAEGAQAFLQRFARKRDLAGLGPVLAHAGALEARLAATGKEVRRAQGLRYRIFFEEGGAIPNPAARLTRRDLCRFDSICDHLVVVDRAAPARDGSPSVVGVYRLLRQDVAERNFGFYSAREFEVERARSRAGPERGSSRLDRPASPRPIGGGGCWNSCGAASGPMRVITPSTR